MKQKESLITPANGVNESFSEALVPELVKLADDTARRDFLRKNPKLVTESTVHELTEVVRRYARVDPHQALAIAEFSVTVAQALDHREALAHSLLAKSNGLYVVGRNREALEHSAQSAEIFRSLDKSTDLARTLNASIQPHILLGEYEQATAAAEEARQIFRAEGNERRLARVELNAGNIFYRQDRFNEALDCYERAYQYFLPQKEKDPEAVAVALHNQATCLISVNDFPRALAAYQEARAFSIQHNMPTVAGHADYNIAWLHYLRGEYGKAIDMLLAVREACRSNGDRYHFALCHMDLSEIYLELNLANEAAEMAQEGAKLLEQLGHGYETAKCLANLAIAYGQHGQAFRAIEIFAKARDIFLREQNRVWPSLIDLYKALLLFNEGRYFEARHLCATALEFFSNSMLPGKAILCRLLMARLHQQLGDLEPAVRECGTSLEILAGMEMPVLNYQAQFLMGKLQLAAGKTAEAYESYQRARAALENLRSTLHGEELKIGFMKNKLQVYEELVELCLAQGDSGAEEAFLYMEQAKSRSLLDSMFRSGSASSTVRGQSQLVRNIAELREELNWYYHRIEIEQLRQEKHSSGRVSELLSKAREREDELLRALREASSAESHPEGFRAPAAISLQEIRAKLGTDETILEYFCVRDRILVALLTRNSLEILPVTVVSRVSNLLRLLQFQLSKPRLGPEYTRTFEKTLLGATQEHLRELYNELIAPVRQRLQARHLIFVPHHVLHHLPFGALFDGERYLVDSFSISYAPSASIYGLCHDRVAPAGGASLLLGVPDHAAPCITDEIRSVAAVLPQAQVFLGPQATSEILQQKGESSRFIHIATHGFFRPDNPMFSGIRLGDSHLSLYDLYQFRWPAELVTLSGCATGLNVIASGDELLGLVRGLIYAGAQSVLLTLWDVHDRSTAEFMKLFYRRLLARPNKGAALQGAMLELREQYPHPFHWAPFTLIGKVSSN
ncbi:MAG TPA: CHAT domain-containing protein [Terriglobales bacterium]|nr:CHAT domain-containing protein [Terriglobales bacterium]